MKEKQKYKKAPRRVLLSLIISIAIAYVLFVLILKKPMFEFYCIAAGFIVAHIILFIGNIIGIIGVIRQNITGKNPIKFYEKAYNISHKFGHPLSPTLLAAYSLELIRINQAKDSLEVIEEGLFNSRYFAVTKNLMTNKGLAFYKLGKVDVAIAIYLEMLKKFGKEDQAFFDEAYSRKLDTDENTDKKPLKLSRIIEENPYFTAPDYTTLGYFYILKKDIENAILFTKLAAKKDEHYAAAYDNFGQIALIQEDDEKAIKYFTKALELLPTLNDSLYYMSKIYLEKGDKDKAREYFNKIDKGAITGLSTITVNQVESLEIK